MNKGGLTWNSIPNLSIGLMAIVCADSIVADAAGIKDRITPKGVNMHWYPLVALITFVVLFIVEFGV